MKNLFLIASRDKYRFESIRGALTVEQLWDLPLQSKSGFDLDNVAKAVNASLKASSEESFVNDATPTSTLDNNKLEIVKHIIAVKKEENARRLAASARATERQRLMEILDAKNLDALKGMSVEDIQARLAALDAEARA